MNDRNLLIIDGHYHLYRFFNGIPHSARLADGTQVNAVYGFIAMLRRLLAAYSDCHMLVVFDSENGSSEKKQQNGDYKANRSAPDYSIFNQLEIIKTLLDDVCIPWIEDSQNEGDDVIASLARTYTSSYQRIYIVSNDKDFYQLLDDQIHIIREHNGTLTHIDSLWVQNTLQISPLQFPLYLALTGDISDNIKGIKGIGPRWAARIIGESSSFDEIMQTKAEIPKRFITALKENHDQIINNLELITMKTNIQQAAAQKPGPVKTELLQNTVSLLKRNGIGIIQ